jgi:hypothetical protein
MNKRKQLDDMEKMMFVVIICVNEMVLNLENFKSNITIEEKNHDVSH